MNYKITLYKRPEGAIAKDIKKIAELLTSRWFTHEVPESVERDLLFQDLMCLEINGLIASFIMFTSLDGIINITLMGTHPDYRGKGFGTILMQHFFEHIKKIGFSKVIAMTVPPDTKEAYSSTVKFYEKNGFVLTHRYNELWESGAVELTKDL